MNILADAGEHIYGLFQKGGDIITGPEKTCYQEEIRCLKDGVPDGDPFEHFGNIGNI